MTQSPIPISDDTQPDAVEDVLDTPEGDIVQSLQPARQRPARKTSQWVGKPGPENINRRLTIREQRFLSHLLRGASKKDAILTAGYKVNSDKMAWEKASKLLRLPYIKYYLELGRQKLRYRFQADTERVVEEQKCIAFADPRECFDPETGEMLSVHVLPERIARALIGIDVIESYAKGGDKLVKYKYRFAPKAPILEQLAKQFGMLTDTVKIEISVPIIKAIIDALPDSVRQRVVFQLKEYVQSQRPRRGAGHSPRLLPVGGKDRS